MTKDEIMLVILRRRSGLVTESHQLIVGKRYDVSKLRLLMWTPPDADITGYDVSSYFRADGTYLGPDQDGIEPLFEKETCG